MHNKLTISLFSSSGAGTFKEKQRENIIYTHYRFYYIHRHMQGVDAITQTHGLHAIHYIRHVVVHDFVMFKICQTAWC